MGVDILHYRAWRGPYRSAHASVWPIVRTSLWMIFRRKLFWVLYSLGLMIFLLFFFGQYLLAWAETQLGESRVPVGMGLREDPRVLVNLFRNILKLNGSADTYANYFWYQGYMVMVLLALAGSILVGNDIRFGSLPFYLSKPLSRWHYVLGKCCAVAVIVNLMTTLPALVLFVQYGLLDSWDYFVGEGVSVGAGDFTLWLPVNRYAVGIVEYGLLLTVCLSLLLVTTASWLRRTVPMIIVWAILLFFCRLLANILVDWKRYDPRWRLIDLWNDAYLVGTACLGMNPQQIRPASQPVWQEAALVLGVVCILCLTYLILRIRAVEIVR